MAFILGNTPSGITKRVNPGIACEKTKLACDASCECMTCQEFRHSIRMRDKTKILYCRAFIYWDEQTKSWIGEKEYTHASNIEEARLIFYRSEDAKTMRRMNIVGVAPVLGYFATDKYGMELTV